MLDNVARVFASQAHRAGADGNRRLLQVARPASNTSMSSPSLLDDIVKDLATWTQNVSEYVMIRARAEMNKRGHQLQ